MNSRCMIIAEIGQAHDGSLGAAHAYIDAAANAGADAVKFQTHIADAEGTRDEQWRVRFSPQDETRGDYWRRMEFTEAQWAGLKEHAVRKNLEFLSSPFSLPAAEMLMRIGVSAWKIASGEINNILLFDYIARTRLPVLLSTGMSPVCEIDAAVERVKSSGAELTVLQCTSAYPCPAEKMGLNLIPYFRERYGCKVGLSDHSGTIYPGLVAAALGIAALEVHIVFSRECFGPDVPASLTTAELRQLTEGVRFIEKLGAHPIRKDEIAGEVAPMRKFFTKSVVAQVNLPAGAVLTRGDLTLKKPGTGIAADRLPELIGRKLRRPIAANQLIQESDLAEGSLAHAGS